MAEINKYNSSLIYTIRSHQTNKYYIGSTIQSLSKRLTGHRSNYKKYLTNNDNEYASSFEILKYSDYYIELLLAYPCNNKDELHRREGELIRQHKSDVVNIFIAGRTDKEYNEDNKIRIKQYRLDNLVQIKERVKLCIICECGTIINKYHKQQHLKSNIHTTNINNLYLNELNYYIL